MSIWVAIGQSARLLTLYSNECNEKRLIFDGASLKRFPVFDSNLVDLIMSFYIIIIFI